MADRLFQTSKRLAFWSVVAFLLSASAQLLPAAEKTDAEAVFAPGKLWQIHIKISPEEYAAIEPRGNRGFGFPPPKTQAPPVDPKREVHKNAFGADLPWGTGSIAIGDTKFEKVGIRYKGNGTIGDTARTAKKSIKIDLDRAGGAGRFAGSKTINLHCGVTDPSKFRETLGYDIYRSAGVPAPRTAYAEVRITVPGKRDNELLGLYTIVEEIDKQFLKSRFQDEKGLLMKPEGLREFEDKGDDWTKYSKQFAPKREATKDEAARLIAFAKLVHKSDDATFQNQIGDYLDINGYLRFLAVTSYVANTDSFFVLGHNYCMYLHPKTNKLHFIPWDLDRAFANFPILGSNGQQMNMSLEHPYAGNHRLTERLLAIPAIGDQFRKVSKELADSAFSQDKLTKQLVNAEAFLKEPLARDAKAVVDRKEGPQQNMFGKPPQLKLFIAKRTKSVTEQVAGTSKGHIPQGGGFGGPPKIGSFLAPQMIEAMDKNDDSKVSREELLGSIQRVWDVCSKDKEGKVDLDSLTKGVDKSIPKPPEGSPQGPFNPASFLASAIMTRADSDKDKKLTHDELVKATQKAFDEFDKSKAGALDDEEFGELLNAVFPLPAFGPPPGGGGPGGRPGGGPGGPPPGGPGPGGPPKGKN